MPRLSIDITDVQHQTLKAMAALQGKSIKDFVLEQTLSDAPDLNNDEAQAMEELWAFLQPRLEQARNGEDVEISAVEIFEEEFRSIENGISDS